MKNTLKAIALMMTLVLGLNAQAATAESTTSKFKVIPNVDNKDSKKYIVIEVLPDQSVWFNACEDTQCTKVLDTPIPAAKVQALMGSLQTSAAKKNSKLKDFLIGAGVTHIGAALVAGIIPAIFASPVGVAPSALGLGAFYSGLYAVAPIAPAIGLLGGIGGEMTGAGLAATIGVAAIPVIAIAVVGGVVYMKYRANKNAKQAAERVMMVNLSQDALIAAVKALDASQAPPLP